MYLIQPHIHCVSRTTEDYQRMALSGVVAVSEPAFWCGMDRGWSESFLDYFNLLTDFEPRRAAQFGIRHFAWMAVNPKECEDPAITREVLKRMPEFFGKPNVLGVGEIGTHKSTRNEIDMFEAQVDLAMKHDQLILIHTPHLEDKHKGTVHILQVLKHCGVNPDRVLVDHVEEHTVKMVLDGGYWAGMTLYPLTKCTPDRACDILEMYGAERLVVNSAADWGVSDPFTVNQCALEYRRRGHTEQELLDVFHNGPARFMGQCPKFDLKPLMISTADQSIGALTRSGR